MPFKMHKIILFSRKKKRKKICVPTVPKVFRPVTRNMLIFLFGLNLLKTNGFFVLSLTQLSQDGPLYILRGYRL